MLGKFSPFQQASERNPDSPFNQLQKTNCCKDCCKSFLSTLTTVVKKYFIYQDHTVSVAYLHDEKKKKTSSEMFPTYPKKHKKFVLSQV